MTVFRNAYFLAILFHAALFAGLGIYTSKTSEPKSSVKETTAAAPAPSTGEFTASSPPFSMAQVVNQISASLVSASRMSPSEQLGAAGDYANRLESISSVSSMKEMGSYLRSTVSWKPPASRAEPGKERVFDHATSMPHGAKQLRDGRYVFVFRDANNNTCELPASPENERAAKAMALLDRSDVLRELKNSILLPMLNQRLDAR